MPSTSRSVVFRIHDPLLQLKPGPQGLPQGPQLRGVACEVDTLVCTVACAGFASTHIPLTFCDSLEWREQEDEPQQNRERGRIDGNRPLSRRPRLTMAARLNRHMRLLPSSDRLWAFAEAMLMCQLLISSRATHFLHPLVLLVFPQCGKSCLR